MILYRTDLQEISFIKGNDYRLGHYFGAWLVDENGRLWNGTQKDGVFIYDPLRQQALNYPLEINRKNLGMYFKAVKKLTRKQVTQLQKNKTKQKQTNKQTKNMFAF